jgi:hypothetical protein
VVTKKKRYMLPDATIWAPPTATARKEEQLDSESGLPSSVEDFCREWLELDDQPPWLTKRQASERLHRSGALVKKYMSMLERQGRLDQRVECPSGVDAGGREVRPFKAFRPRAWMPGSRAPGTDPLVPVRVKTGGYEVTRQGFAITDIRVMPGTDLGITAPLAPPSVNRLLLDDWGERFMHPSPPKHTPVFERWRDRRPPKSRTRRNYGKECLAPRDDAEG